MNGKVDVLVATDVAARGIDVEGVTHVVNYQCPEDEKTYLHRIGRTARAGAKGIAVTFVDWDDIPRWTLINKALGLGFEEPPETYSTSDHLYEALDIPGHVTGVLPRADRTREGLGAEAVEDIGETGMRSKRPTQAHASGRGTSSNNSKPSGTRKDVAPAADEPKASARRASGTRTRTRGGASSGEKSSGARTAEAAPAATDGAPKRSRRRRGRRGTGSGTEATGTSAPAAS
jgi:superfamily II DNA/RNA helicase